jgi:hypothetical protein
VNFSSLRHAIVLVTLASTSLAGARDCRDVFLSSPDLEAALDEVLGDWSSVVSARKVLIEPANPSCYLQVRILVSVPLADNCMLKACSVATFRGQQIGLRAFDVHGCEALNDLFPGSRHIPTVLTDVSDQIRSRCGSADYQITAVAPAFLGTEPRVHVQLRPLQAPQSKQ